MPLFRSRETSGICDGRRTKVFRQSLNTIIIICFWPFNIDFIPLFFVIKLCVLYLWIDQVGFYFKLAFQTCLCLYIIIHMSSVISILKFWILEIGSYVLLATITIYMKTFRFFQLVYVPIINNLNTTIIFIREVSSVELNVFFSFQ